MFGVSGAKRIGNPVDRILLCVLNLDLGARGLKQVNSLSRLLEFESPLGLVLCHDKSIYQLLRWW